MTTGALTTIQKGGTMNHQCRFQRPSVHWIDAYLSVICFAVVVLVALIKMTSQTRLKQILSDSGVAVAKLSSTLKEIERKTFHLTGLLIPLWYTISTDIFGYSELACVIFALLVTLFVWVSEAARLTFPFVQNWFMSTFMGSIMRDREATQLTGTAYFTLGCSLAMAMFPKDIAITSMMYLVCGDMMAALIGVSFGGDACVVKLGREGKKSVEGSLGCFTVCFFIGYTMFNEFRLPEYIAFTSALVATITELWSEDLLNLNDNVTIPLFSCVGMAWAIARVDVCAESL